MVLAVDINGQQRSFSCATWEVMDKANWTLLESNCGGRVEQYGRPFAHGNDANATGGGDKHYSHTQNMASGQWHITHNLNKYPSVTVIDSGGSVVNGELEYDGLNALILTFSAPFTGVAQLN